jgi:broad specificity phosphatase PhoE
VTRAATRAACAALLLSVLPGIAAAQQAILIVRHSERQSGQGDDSLSEVGHQRAERLAVMLKDAGVSHIFVSDRRRTQETAQPLARARMLSPTRVPIPDDARSKINPAELQVRATLAAVAKLPRSAVILIVGHSNTIPIFLRRLGYAQAVTIGDNEFDNLFVVTPRTGNAPSVVRLRY